MIEDTPGINLWPLHTCIHIDTHQKTNGGREQKSAVTPEAATATSCHITLGVNHIFNAQGFGCVRSASEEALEMSPICRTWKKGPEAPRVEQVWSTGGPGCSLLSTRLRGAAAWCGCLVRVWRLPRKRLFSMLYIPCLQPCSGAREAQDDSSHTEHLPPVPSPRDCEHIHLKQMAISTPTRPSCNFPRGKETEGLKPLLPSGRHKWVVPCQSC